MHKLMCRFVTTTKKKIPDPNLDTACPAGIPCNKIKNAPDLLQFALFLCRTEYSQYLYPHSQIFRPGEATTETQVNPSQNFSASSSPDHIKLTKPSSDGRTMRRKDYGLRILTALKGRMPDGFFISENKNAIRFDSILAFEMRLILSPVFTFEICVVGLL